MRSKLSNVFKLLFITLLVVSLGCFFVACGGNNEETAKYTVTVINGTGGGEYEENTDVTVTATVPEGQTFEKWTSDGADVSTDNPYTFKVTKDITLTAVFDDPTVVKYTVTVINGSGTGRYAENSQVTVVAAETEGRIFIEWRINGEKVSEDAEYTFTVTENVTLTAVFEDVEIVEVSSALVIGDVHLAKEESCKTNLLKTLRYVKANKNIKVLLFNGDSVDFASQANYDLFDACLEEVFGDVATEDRPQFLFNMGNHEFYPNVNCDYRETVYSREFGLFRTFANKWMTEPIGEDESVYMRKVDGISYIVIFPGNSQLAAAGGFLDSDFETLRTYLDQATVDGAPCIVATHWAWGYTYGGPSYGMPDQNIVRDFTQLLTNYPSVINVTSHTHFSDLHERDLDQTNYTTVNVGTHCLGKHVSGVETDENGDAVTYMNISGRGINSTVDNTAFSMYWSGTIHFGIKMQFGEESVVIKRCNIGKGQDYEHGSWTIPYGITTDNKHDKFYYEAGERQGETLTFDSAETLYTVLAARPDSDNVSFTLRFNDVDQYWAVEGYKAEIYDADNQLVKKAWWQSLFWTDRGQKSSYSFKLSDVPRSSQYTVKVYPMDFFGHYNEPLTKFINTAEEPIDSHPDAIEISAKYTYDPAGFGVDKFSGSSKAFTFEYKPVEKSTNTGNNIAFTLWTVNWSPRVTGLVYVDIVNNTVTDGVQELGKVEELENGWHRVTIDCVDMPLNYGEGATGNEDVRVLYFNTVNHAFLLDGVGFVDGKVAEITYGVGVKYGTGAGSYKQGTEVTVTAEVIEDRTFVEWQVDGVRVSKDNPYTFTVTQDVALVAVYDPPIVETKEYLKAGYAIALPDYDPAHTTTLEFDVFAVGVGNTYARINIVFTDTNGVSTKFYRVTYAGVNMGYNAEGVSCSQISENTWHVVMTLSELTNGSGVSLGKVVKMSDGGSKDLGGCWIDNIEFKA